jgi:hypothetical protein
MAILAGAPWNVANPLLMKIGEQLRRQSAGLNSNLASMERQEGKTQ